MPAPSPTSCPACSYELSDLFERGRVTCPECGRRWWRGQVLALNSGRVYWGAAGTMLASTPLVVVLVASFLRLSPLAPARVELLITQTAVVVYLWLWVALAMFFARNSRKRLSDFSPIAGIVTGAIAALLILACLGIAAGIVGAALGF